MTRRATAAAVAVGALVASVATATSSWAAMDYPHDAGPALAALVRGDVQEFLALQPLMGSFSLLLRAPFVWVADAAGWEGQAAAYRAGALACLLAAAALAIALDRLMARRGQPAVARLVVAGLVVAGPMIANAMMWGHPEEVLAGALCVGAALAAGGRRPVAAGVLLGLALATKQWAIIAILPVLLAAPGRRVRLAVAAGLVAAALTVPFVAAAPDRAGAIGSGAIDVNSLVFPASLWWPVASERQRTVPLGGGEIAVVSRYSLTPEWLDLVPHPLIALVPLPLALAFARRRGRLAGDALGLLALVLLLRCVLEPWNIGYYHVPFLLALVAFEAVRWRGLPVLSMLAALACWATFGPIQRMQDDLLTNVFYLGWSLPAAAALFLAVQRPGIPRPLRLLERVLSGPALRLRRPSLHEPRAVTE